MSRAESRAMVLAGFFPFALFSPPPSIYKPVDPVVINDVLDGKYGIGTERIMALREAGYDPTEVQKKINALYVIGAKVKAAIGAETQYINQIIKIARM